MRFLAVVTSWGSLERVLTGGTRLGRPGLRLAEWPR
jgi:hypothetical protein